MALEALLSVLSISLVLTCSESGSVHWIRSSWLQDKQQYSLKLHIINHDLKCAIHVINTNRYIMLRCQNSFKRDCVIGHTHKHTHKITHKISLDFLSPSSCRGLVNKQGSISLVFTLQRWPSENGIRNAAVRRQTHRGQHRPLLLTQLTTANSLTSTFSSGLNNH